MAEIPSAPIKRLMVEASGGMRVGGSALDYSVAATETFLRQLGRIAGECAMEDKRKTIQDSDIASALAVLGRTSNP